jgi:hypothetical protein
MSGDGCLTEATAQGVLRGRRGIDSIHSRIRLSTLGASMTEPTYDELKAQLEALKAKEARSGTMSFKVSDKGGVSVYGLGRFPVTLYYEQWIKLLDRAQDLREFLEANKEKLKLKE